MGAPHPIVLVGGRSTRFGRDKLREPLEGGGWLVDRAVEALRAATGRAVTLVGTCDPEVARRGDAHLEDAHAGQGPAGGLLTALDRLGDVIVLPGDLPRVLAPALAPLLRAAEAQPSTLAIRARGEPLVAIYRRALAPRIAARLAAGRRSLHDLVAGDELFEVDVPEDALVNANTPAALEPSGVFAFEGIDEALELVPLAARRALDRAGVHLSLEGWRALPRDARRALVAEGAREQVAPSVVRALVEPARALSREVAPSTDPDPERAPAALLEALGADRARVAARWSGLSALERFALVHGLRSAERRGEPERLLEIVRAVIAG